MDNLLTVAFEAHTSELNHHRRYQITVGRDLLENWTVAIHYGRTGRGGHEQRFSSPKAEEVRAIIRDRLRRRLSATKRIGCAYRMTMFSSVPGFEASGWLPGDILTGFFRECRRRPGRNSSQGAIIR
jgi:hypothetical protein